ncbi:hypothetical protein FACS189443_4550 [Planctomycetales bacterium]|nr:hypothetical protein FACS189443_4550 [Planctomycetales bacterium]
MYLGRVSINTYNYSGGGTVTLSENLALDNLTLSLANASNLINFDASKITSLKNTSITVYGGELNFANVTELENVTLSAQNGAVIKFPAVRACALI